jgi:hypothetical protein
MDVVAYNNGLPDGLIGHEMTRFIETEDFTFGGIQIIKTVSFGAYSQSDTTSYQRSIAWRFYFDADGTLAIFLMRVRLFRSEPFVAPEWEAPPMSTICFCPEITLAAGKYWIGIHNGPLHNHTDKGAVLGNIIATRRLFFGKAVTTPLDDNIWQSASRQHAFVLVSATVPTPEPRYVNFTGLGLPLITRLGRRA